MTSYLFYSPQLDGIHSVPSNVPPITAHVHSHANSPQIPPPSAHPVVPSDLNLTPNFGPQNYLPQQQEPIRHESRRRHMGGARDDIDVSFLNSGLPPTHATHTAGLHGTPDRSFLPYMPVYTSPYVGPTYSPMFPMMFGVPPHESFEPLPESQWAEKPEMYSTHGGSMGPGSRYLNAHGGSHLNVDQRSMGGVPYHQHQQHQQHQHQQHPHQHQHHQNQYMNNQQPPNKSVLDDLRIPPHARAHSLHDIVQECLVADLATDQNGSRFIQTKLEEATDEEKQAVFDQILPETLRLCTDVFGNYCIQKFFEYGTPEQKQHLATKIKNRVLPLSLQMYGCRVVQKILESVDGELQTMLIQELDGHVLECVKDQNANHVIQKCIERVSSSHRMIQKSFFGRAYDLSTHPYGCRVIQRMLEHCDHQLKAPLLEELMAYADQLAKDQYGNYVLQHVLQHSSMECRDSIIQTVADNILPFSKHKFASNVVERCFVSVESHHKDVLLDAVVGNAEGSPLVSMVRDQYGNYVIQKMLETLNVQQRNKLIRKISEYVPNIRKIAFGKHIVAKVEKLTGKII